MHAERISSCTYPVRECTVERALEIMAEAGVHKADLWGSYPHFSLNAVQCDLEQLRQKAADRGIAIANLGSYPGRQFASDDPDIRAAELDTLKATLRAAKALGARSIRVMPGHGEDPAIIERIAPYFARGAEVAAEIGVYMGMENHAGSLAGNPEAVTHLCEAVGSGYFGVLYEPCNLMHGGQDYERAFEVFADHIVHIHVKDGRRGSGGWERCHLGEGEIDYAWVVEQMEGIGYTGDYALEYEICDLEPIESGLPRWVEYFKAV